MSSSSSNSQYLQDTANCLNCFGLAKTKKQTENASSTALVSLKAQTGPAATSFPYNRLPPELRVMIIKAIHPGFFSENVGRLAISREWYFYASRHLLENLSISRMSDPFAAFEHHIQGPNDEFFDRIQGPLEARLTHLTMDLDRMLRRYQFLPTDADSHALPDLEGRRAIDDLDPERESLKPWMRAPRRDPTSLEQAACITMDLLRGPVWYLRNVTSWDISIREPWGLHRDASTHLDWAFSWTLAELSDQQSVVLDRVKLDIPGLARRDTLWTRDERYQLHEDAPFFLLDAEGRAGISEDPDAAAAWEDPYNVIVYQSRHLCSSIQKILPHLEVLHLRTRSMCPEMFRPSQHELNDFYRGLWPRYVNLPSWDRHVPRPLDAFESPPINAPLPKLKEVIINMIMPWMRYKNCRVVSCATHDCNLTRSAEIKFGDIAYNQMIRESVALSKRMTSPSKVVVRYTEVSLSDLNMKHWEYDALTDTDRRISVDQWGDFVEYIGPPQHNALERDHMGVS